MNTPQQSGVKRHSMTGNPFNSDARDVEGDMKRARNETQALTRIAITADDYPETWLDHEVSGKIRKHLWKMLEKKPIKTVTWVGLRAGFISIDCSGKDAINWLKCINGEIIGGVPVKVVLEKTICRPVRMIWRRIKIDNEMSITDELDILQKLYPELFTRFWQQYKTTMKGSQTCSEIKMDQKSADVIRDAGYKLHAGLEPSSFQVCPPKGKAIAGGKGVAIAGGRKKLNKPEEMLDVQIIEEQPNPTLERLDGFQADFSGLEIPGSDSEDDIEDDSF